MVATDEDDDPLSTSWQINDVEFASTAIAQHVFPDTGNFVVVVSVSDTQFTVTGEIFIHVIDTTTAVDPNILLPESFAVNAYPNPFNNEARIAISLPNSSAVKVEIFSVDGRRVKVIEPGILAAGEHQLSWQPDGLAAGAYFLNVRAGDQLKQLKLIYLK